MKNADNLIDMLSKKNPIVIYNPIYTGITGSVNAGLLLGALIYWSKTKKHGEFYKTDKELMEETGMNFNELRAAKKKIIDSGIFSIEIKSLPAKTYYKLRLERLIILTEEKIKNAIKRPKPVCGKSPNQFNENQQTECLKSTNQFNENQHTTSENTSEITTEITTENNINKSNTKYLEVIPSTKGDFCIPSDYVCFNSLAEVVSQKEEISERSKKAKNDVKENNLKINNEFNEFWKNYPIKVEKNYALNCFKQAITKTSMEEILTALQSQKEERSGRERLGLWIAPWKNPSTWLNKGCWNDIPKTLEELEREKEEQMSRFKKTQIDKEDEDMKKLNKILEGCL